MQNENIPDFPHAVKLEDGATILETSMSLRDYFAAKALQGLVISTQDIPRISTLDIAKESYELADAMLAVRAKEQS